MRPPRLLISEWLPAAAIGVECIRERATGQQSPDKRLDVWWARRPLTASRAAALGSLLPANFFRDRLASAPYTLDANGCVKPLEAPGIGVEVDEDFLARHPVIEGPGYV